MDERRPRGDQGVDEEMNKFLTFLRNITMGPMERHRPANADKVLAYPLFLMCMSAKLQFNKCHPLLKEIADLDHEQPVPLELRMAVKECLRELEEEDKLCP